MHKLLAYSIMALTLTACGHTSGERAVSGAGIGAATGMGAAALTGGSVWTGAAWGAAAGAVAGAVTDENQINLGKPVWK